MLRIAREVKVINDLQFFFFFVSKLTKNCYMVS